MQTLFERIVTTAMLISAAVLVFLVVRETTRSDEGSAAPAAATVARVLAVTSPATTPATPAATAALPRPVKKAAPPLVKKAAPRPAEKPLARLLLVAAGGDTWLTVRAESAQGKVLYTGLLAQGAEVEAKAKQLWVRFGGAGNVTARLNGKSLPLRSGTYNALITTRGLQLVAG